MTFASPPTPLAPRRRRPMLVTAVAVAVAVVLLATYVAIATGQAHAASTLLSQGRPATSSSNENAGLGPANAVDGNTGTRWSSGFSDPEWIQVDLGATAGITQVVLNWQAAYGKAFQIQVSDNATTWTTIFSTTTGTGGVQTLNITGTGRYVRMYGTQRATQYGYSLWEFQVFGTIGGGGGSGDYAQGVTATGTGSVQIWFKPTTPSSLVDVHYLPNGGGQQDFRMTNDAGTWQQNVNGLNTGSVLTYWFTYEKSGPLYVTPQFTYTVGGGSGGGSAVATPTFNPPGGSYAAAQSVTITTATAGATIRYTLDGSTPTASSPQYTGPISVTTSEPIQAIGIKSGLTNSPVGSASYTIGTTGGGPGTFPITFLNNTRGTHSDAQIYVMFLFMATPGQWSYLKPDGTVTHINHLDATAPGHLTKNGVNYANMSFSLAQAATVPSPPNVAGGRIYISIGSPMYIPISPDDAGWGGPDLRNPADPNADVYYDWYEYTYTSGSTFGGNTTQVDQFGFPMTARLQVAAIGYDQTVGITLTRAQVMSQYTASVGAAFKPLENQYRIVAPRSANQFYPGGTQANYLQAYIDQTWAYYTANPFTLTRLGQTYTGRVSGTVMSGTGPAGGWTLNKPTTIDVLACAGALASGSGASKQMGAEFCAAFNRGVAMNTVNWYSPATYYMGATKNDYAGFFHPISINNRSYAFAYDDINDQSSVQIVNGPNPITGLTLGIGW